MLLTRVRAKPRTVAVGTCRPGDAEGLQQPFQGDRRSRRASLQWTISCVNKVIPKFKMLADEGCGLPQPLAGWAGVFRQLQRQLPAADDDEPCGYLGKHGRGSCLCAFLDANEQTLDGSKSFLRWLHHGAITNCRFVTSTLALWWR